MVYKVNIGRASTSQDFLGSYLSMFALAYISKLLKYSLKYGEMDQLSRYSESLTTEIQKFALIQNGRSTYGKTIIWDLC